MRSAASVQLPTDSVVLVSTSSLYSARNCASPSALAAWAPDDAMPAMAAMARTGMKRQVISAPMEEITRSGMRAIRTTDGSHGTLTDLKIYVRGFASLRRLSPVPSHADARLQFQHRGAPGLVIVAVGPQLAQFRALRQHALDDAVGFLGQVGTRLLRPLLDPRIDAGAFLGTLAPMSLQARDDLDRHQRLGRERRFQFIAAVIERVVQRVLDRVHIFQLLQILGPVQREVIAESVHRPCTHRILLAYFCVFTTCIAAAIKPLISPRLAGMMMELLVLASCANAFTYCSATFRLTASEPPGDWIAAPTSRSAAVASASATMAAACPCARL